MNNLLSINMDFKMPKNKSSVIKVIGIGGGGGNAINYMCERGIQGVDFVICNTDTQALENSPITNKVKLGKDGLGAGGDPKVGEAYAKESINNIKEILEFNTKMVFITAGMGGGTGTGAAPVIAKVCKELNILTVAVVTTPFQFEGPKRKESAKEGIKKLKQYVDSIILINNDKLRDIYGDFQCKKAFAIVNEILCTATKSIAELITKHFLINIDLKDAKTVLSNSGNAIMGSATAKGENRAKTAIEKALASPLLNNNNIKGATNVLLQIFYTTNNELTIDEISIINEYIQNESGYETDIIEGMGEDETLKEDEIKVTIIATGFTENQEEDSKKIIPLEDEQPITQEMDEIQIPTKRKTYKTRQNINQPTLFDVETLLDPMVNKISEMKNKPLNRIHNIKSFNNKCHKISETERERMEKEPAFKRLGWNINNTKIAKDKKDIKTLYLDDDTDNNITQL